MYPLFCLSHQMIHPIRRSTSTKRPNGNPMAILEIFRYSNVDVEFLSYVIFTLADYSLRKGISFPCSFSFHHNNEKWTMCAMDAVYFVHSVILHKINRTIRWIAVDLSIFIAINTMESIWDLNKLAFVYISDIQKKYCIIIFKWNMQKEIKSYAQLI